MDHTTAAAASAKAQMIEKISTATAVTAGGSTLYFGLTANEIAAFVGAGVAVLSLIVQIFYKHQHFKLAKATAEAVINIKGEAEGE